jgi:hypothetical protein
MLAKAAATSSGGGGSIVDTDLYINYDFSDTDCWNRNNSANAADYTVHNLANDYNDALFRSRTGTSDAYRDASDSPCIDFNSSDGGGCLEIIPSNISSDSDIFSLVIPGSYSSSTSSWATYNITTVSGTDTNNLFNGVGTGAFTIELWSKVYLDHSVNSLATNYFVSADDVVSTTSSSYSNSFFTPDYSFSSYQNKMRFTYGSWGSKFLDISGAPSSGAAWSNWNHFVYSRNSDATNDTKIYLNNSLEETVTDVENLDYLRYAYLDHPWLAVHAGKRIGIFRFYRGKALTSSEVTTNWNAQKSRFGH